MYRRVAWGDNVRTGREGERGGLPSKAALTEALGSSAFGMAPQGNSGLRPAGRIRMPLGKGM